MPPLRLLTLALGLIASAALVAQQLLAQQTTQEPQQPWREYPSMERSTQGRFGAPQGQPLPAEFSVGRLRYPQSNRGPFGRGRGAR
ncbi:MAG: hypothetical protein LBF16_05510, partial [Pseudomonadales bacterium]|nr:hypothetical protein [Pseudomonadales bacterium]